MPIDRRALIGGGLFGLAALKAGPLMAQPAPGALISPNLPSRGSIRELDLIVGLRPVRADGVRLEFASAPPRTGSGPARTIIHNYGHAGGGITLAPGCADWIVRQLQRRQIAPTRVAVLGAGIVGLSAASALRKAGHQVTVVSAVLPDELVAYRNVTSSIAGGQFAPSFAKFNGGQDANEILRASAREYLAAPADWGVKRVKNYTPHRSHDELEHASRALGAVPERLATLPFAGLRRQPGWAYPTLLVETPLYLRKLYLSLLQPWQGRPPVAFVKDRLGDREAVLKLPQSVIVNCMGLGGGIVEGVDDVRPNPGLLVRLPAQDKLDYLYSGVGYVFPRADALIIGGTVEFPRGKAENGKHNVQADGWKLIESARSVFGGSCPATVTGMSGARRVADLSACARRA